MIGTTKQQVGRLERSKRGLDERWVMLLSVAFKVHPGEIWEEMPNADLTEREHALLGVFRRMDDAKQEAFVQAVDALAQPIAEKKHG